MNYYWLLLLAFAKLLFKWLVIFISWLHWYYWYQEYWMCVQYVDLIFFNKVGGDLKNVRDTITVRYYQRCRAFTNAPRWVSGFWFLFFFYFGFWVSGDMLICFGLCCVSLRPLLFHSLFQLFKKGRDTDRQTDRRPNIVARHSAMKWKWTVILIH